MCWKVLVREVCCNLCTDLLELIKVSLEVEVVYIALEVLTFGMMFLKALNSSNLFFRWAVRLQLIVSMIQCVSRS